jgi:hypothetical protein
MIDKKPRKKKNLLKQSFRISHIKWILPLAVLFVLVFCITQIIDPRTSLVDGTSYQTGIESSDATSPISLAPDKRKSGWNADIENQILAMCPAPVKLVHGSLCTCALAKVEEQYTALQAQEMLKSYQKDKSVDPRLQSILLECK